MKRESGRVLSRCLLLALLVGAGLVLLNASPGVAEDEEGLNPGWRDLPEGHLEGVNIGVDVWTTPTILDWFLPGRNLTYRINANGVPRECGVNLKVEIWYWAPGTPTPVKPPAFGFLVHSYPWSAVTSSQVFGGGTHHVPAGFPSGTVVEIRVYITCTTHNGGATKTRSSYYIIP